MKRRDFLKKAVTVPAMVAATEWYAAAEALSPRPRRITAVLYDERYADCRSFAEALEKQGAISFATFGDAASVWYDPLRACLAQAEGSVAGMATDSDWVVSRLCGRELGLKEVYEGSHDSRASDRLIHRLHGSGAEREVYAALLHPGVPWAESIATGLIRSVGRRGGTIGSTAPITKTDAVRTGRFTDHPGYLVSWLLDPSTL
jgi:hypothetical protein